MRHGQARLRGLGHVEALQRPHPLGDTIHGGFRGSAAAHARHSHRFVHHGDTQLQTGEPAELAVLAIVASWHTDPVQGVHARRRAKAGSLLSFSPPRCAKAGNTPVEATVAGVLEKGKRNACISTRRRGGASAASGGGGEGGAHGRR